MPPSTAISTSIVVIVLTAAMLSSWTFHRISSRRKRQDLRQKLPPNLDIWRIPGETREAHEQIWNDLDSVFRAGGLTLWPSAFLSTLESPDLTYPASSGYGYAIPERTASGRLGHVGRLRRFAYTNALSRAARTREGLDVVVRVIVIGNEGHDHLKMLRKIATGENSLYSNNHVLPMFAEFRFEDIVFGVFPKVGAKMSEAYHSWTKNSVGDIVYMISQMLEALVYIHDLGIAHRDVFRDNFIVQWHPESLLTMETSASRPRVYLIDFEFAVEFPPDCPETERVSVGYPLGGSATDSETYARPLPPEITSGEPYSPFKLDVWQLGNSFSDFSSTIPAIDKILRDMTDIDALRRPDSKQAFDRIEAIVRSMTPESLLIAPVVTQSL